MKNKVKTHKNDICYVLDTKSNMILSMLSYMGIGIGALLVIFCKAETIHFFILAVLFFAFLGLQKPLRLLFQERVIVSGDPKKASLYEGFRKLPAESYDYDRIEKIDHGDYMILNIYYEGELKASFRVVSDSSRKR